MESLLGMDNKKAASAKVVAKVVRRFKATGAQQKVRAVLDWIDVYQRNDRPSLDEGVRLAGAIMAADSSGHTRNGPSVPPQSALDAYNKWVSENGQYHIEKSKELKTLVADAKPAVAKANRILLEARAAGITVHFHLPVLPEFPI